MLLRLENVLQKFITKIESVLDRSSVWGRANNPLRSKRCKRCKKYNFCIISDLKFSFVIGNFSHGLKFLRLLLRRDAWLVEVQCTMHTFVKAYLCAGYNGQNTMHSCMYNLQKRDVFNYSLLRTIWASSWFSGWGGWCPFPAMIGVNVWSEYNLFFFKFEPNLINFSLLW